MNLADKYTSRFKDVLPSVAAGIEQQLGEYLKDEKHIDRISARPKSVERFLAKAAKTLDGISKYSDPINQIQDQVGARIIVFYLSDVQSICRIIEKYYRPVESMALVPESEWEFGYFGMHYILFVPTAVAKDDAEGNSVPEFFELQIKTLFQHAWSEANHDLGYKSGSEPLTSDQKRRLAFTAAQAWGADRIFEELCKERSADMRE